MEQRQIETRTRRQNLVGLKFSVTRGNGEVCDFEFVAGDVVSTILLMNGERFIYWSGCAPEFRVMAALHRRGFSAADIEQFWDAARSSTPNFARWAS